MRRGGRAPGAPPGIGGRGAGAPGAGGRVADAGEPGAGGRGAVEPGAGGRGAGGRGAVEPGAVEPGDEEPGAGGRIVFHGPDVRVAPERVNALAMTLQELATNCLKHGALSVPDGSVDISWTVGAPDDGRVRLTWCESGCSPVAEPVEGTGLSLLRSLVAIDLEGAAHFEFAPGGLTCTIDLQTHEKHLRKIALNGAAP